MNCVPAETWLLAARSLDDLPGEVRGHVAGCDHCLARMRLFSQVDRRAAGLVQPGDPSVRCQLDERLKTLDQPRPSTRRLRSPRSRGPALAILVVAVGILGWLIGWTTGRMNSTRNPVTTPAPVTPAEPASVPVESFDFRLVGFAVEITSQDSPAAHAVSLNTLAADIRNEAVRTAEAGRLRELPRLALMHDRVIRQGLAGVLPRLPDEGRRTVSTQVTADLIRAGGELNRRADAMSPVIGEQLRSLADSCVRGAEQIRLAKATAGPAGGEAPGTPEEELIRHSLRFAMADSSMARADASADLSGVLTQLITTFAFAGHPEEASRLGESLDLVILRGVAGNLDRSLNSQPTEAAREEIASIRQRSSRATQALERNLAKAPPAARAGLERALNASAKGRERLADPAEGNKPVPKGPPWKKGEFEHPGKGNPMPPGWQKKSVP